MSDSVDDAATTVRGPEGSVAVEDAHPTLSKAVGSGRYVVVCELGRGASGVVLRAYDAQLHREVAIKRIRTSGMRSKEATRVIREARAMARLSHSNVVSVFDVFTEDDNQIVVVMEYVAGGDLGSWMAESRSWQTVVRAFLSAGRGLAAAHDAGLLHRDFKPANVLLRSRGPNQRPVVKVADFGLAKFVDDERSDGDVDGPVDTDASRLAAEAQESTLDADEADLTGHRTVMGTPRYMSPEQHRGDPLTTSTDQYAFAAAMWLALTGLPAFHGGSLVELYLAKQKGRPDWPAGESDIPPRIREALARAMSPDPDERWPSVQTLLVELSEAISRPRTNRRRFAVAGAGLGVVAAAALVLSPKEDRRCTGGPELIEDAWNEAHRREASAAFDASGLRFAPSAWERASTTLDEFAGSWATAYRESCAATTIRSESSPEAMDARMACLERARADLRAAVAVLTRADGAAVERSTALTGALPPPMQCLDARPDDAASNVAPSTAQESAIDDLLTRARAERRAGHYEASLRMIQEAARLLPAIDQGRLEARTWAARGVVQQALGNQAEAAADHRKAVRVALASGEFAVVQEATAQLMVISAFMDTNSTVADAHRRVGTALTHGDPDRDLTFLQSEAIMLNLRGRYEESLAAGQRALDLLAHSNKTSDPHLRTRFRALRAQNLRVLGRREEAEAELRDAVHLARESHGPRHPDVGRLKAELAMVLQALDRLDEARQEFGESIELLESSFRLDTPLLAAVHTAYASLLRKTGDPQAAESLQRESIVSLSTTVDDRHPFVAQARIGLAEALKDQGRLSEAEDELLRGLDGFRSSLGHDHPRVASALGVLASLLEAMDRPQDVVAVYAEALAIRRARLGPRHPNTERSQRQFAAALSAAGRSTEALDIALPLWEARPDPARDPKGFAQVAWLYARVSWDARPSVASRRQARDVAERARKAYQAAGIDTPDVDAWLDSHRI